MKSLKVFFFLTYKLPRNIIIVLFLIYTLIGFFILPMIIKSQAEKFVLENYKETLQIDKIKFNPFTFELAISNFNIPDTNSGGMDKSRLKFDNILINLEIFPLFFKKITFKEVALNGAHVYFSFYKNKKNNWLSFVTPVPELKEKSKSNWTLVFEKMSLDKDYFYFKDFNYPKPVNLPLGPLSLRAVNITTKLDSQTVLENLFINLEKNGSLQLQGKISISPPAAELKIITHKFPLDFLTAYLSSTTYMEINKGYLDVIGKISYHDSDFKIKGDAKVYNFLMKKTIDNSDIVEIKNVDFKNLSYSLTPRTITLDKAVVTNLKSHVILNPDGTLNFKELIRPLPAAEAPDSKKSPPTTYQVGDIEIINSEMNYSDLQIKPNFKAYVHDLSGNFGPVSSSLDNKINISLTGMVEDQGKFTTKGFYFQSKQPKILDLGVNFSNIEMTTFSPYSGHFAGYEIKKGKLFLELNYKLKNNRILGKNIVRLDNFTLGEKVESKNSTYWPLKLALALLKDRKGQIKFNLPVEGDINSPKFSYGSLIRTALYNMLVNIVSAPFDFLSKLVGGGKEIQLMEFENQTVVFKIDNEIKLDKVSKLLEERPELKLEILGTCSEKEFLVEGKENPVIPESKYKEIGLQRAQLIQNLLVKKNINAERLFVMAGKKNDDSIGPSGAILIFKAD